MSRIVLAALGVGVALAALAHCGGTTGTDSPLPAMVDGADATVEGGSTDSLDAGSDRSVYTNTFDVYIQYADQALPDVQTPTEGGSQSGPGVPDCPPFIYVDGDGKPLPPGTCDPTGQCFSQSDAVPADWTDGGETLAAEGGACATYPWLGSLGIDECMTPNGIGETFNLLPPCNWAREAGAATQGSAIGTSRYTLCLNLYECFMRTNCFLNPKPAGMGTGIFANPFSCLCEQPGENFSAAACLQEEGPCYDQEVAALEAPVSPSDPNATPSYAASNFFQTMSQNGVVGNEGANLNGLFDDLLSGGAPCIPKCALDAGLDCGP
jgi:hypothetical protein